MNDVYTKFRDYLDVKPDDKSSVCSLFQHGIWFKQRPEYSGGLGVLAGDYLKRAFDSNVDLCAVEFVPLRLLYSNVVYGRSADC